MTRIDMIRYLFGVLASLALVLAAIQHFNLYNLYGEVSNKWYFWSIVIIMFFVCILVALSAPVLGRVKGSIDRVFFLPPSFFALLSGALLGTSLNFLTNMLPLIQPVKHVEISALATLLVLCSSILLGYISITLEDMRDKMKGLSEEKQHLRIHIKDRWKPLWFSLFSGIALVIIGFLVQYFALR